MSPTLEYSRTYLFYREEGHSLKIPSEFVHLDPDVLDINANHLDVWTEPPGEPLPPDRRDAIVAWVRAKLDADGAVYTWNESEYLRRRALPFEVTFEGPPMAPSVAYVRDGRRAVFARSTASDGRTLVHTSAVHTWTVPPQAPLTDADRTAIEADIRQHSPWLRFA